METGVKTSAAEARGLFVGRFDHNLDPKRRITIPATWREIMGSSGYVYVIPDPFQCCLNLLSVSEMEVRLEKLRQQALFNPDSSEALRVIGENSEQLQWDVQGRIRIRDRLLAFAKLSAQVVMIGAVNRVQLWSPELRPEMSQVDQTKLADAVKQVVF
ncbi:MAG: hypothetical protein GX230_01675 [Lentisphaerae bacterium]|jgi:MraZ protein|nr:hypothetical protein [Lentisphaerota bacterium]